MLFLSPFVAGVPGPANITFRATQMAGILAMPCPIVNSGLWLRRFVDELNLTEVCMLIVSFPPAGKLGTRFHLPPLCIQNLQKLFPIAWTLYTIYGPTFEDNLQLRSSSSPLHPWAILMAFIIIAAKLACKLDGKEPVLTDVVNDIEWFQWSRSHFSKMQILSAYPLKSAEVNLNLFKPFPLVPIV